MGKQISSETGARVDIQTPAEGEDDSVRLVTITCHEQPNCMHSGAQDALHRVMMKINDSDDRNNPGLQFSLKLVTPRSLAGGVIGKGGTVVSSIRRQSGA